MINLKLEKPAKRYARALFQTIENKNEKKVLDEIKAFFELTLNPELNSFLFHPIVSKEDKKSAISEICKDFEEETAKFLYILLDEGRLDCLSSILKFLEDEYNKKNNILKFDVILAIEPTESIKAAVVGRLKNKFNSEIQAN